MQLNFLKKRLAFAVTAFVALSVNMVYAQSYSGLRDDAFTPITSIALNPAAIYGSLVNCSINIAAAGASVNNNYLYYNQKSALSLISYVQQHDALPDPSFNTVNQVRAFADGFIQGPSALFKFKSFSIGFIDDERWMASATSDNSASQMLPVYRLPLYTENRIPPFNAAFMNFGEVGINLGMPLSAKNLFGAITIKYLMGYDGATVQNIQPFHYQYDTANGHVSNFDGEIAFSTPIGKGNYSYGPRQWLGHGTAIDIGILELHSAGNDQQANSYKWKLGASITDIGMMRYSVTSATYLISTANTFLIPLPQLQKTVDLGELVKLGAKQIYDKNKAAIAAYSFTEFLPAMASVQFDYSLSQKWWVNMTAMQRIHVFSNQIIRPNLFVIAPRYQTKFFTVNFPVSIYDYNQVQIGTSVRAGFLTVGSDNLPALFVPSKFSGADIYASLVIFPWMIEKELHGVLHSHDKKNLNCPKL